MEMMRGGGSNGSASIEPGLKCVELGKPSPVEPEPKGNGMNKTFVFLTTLATVFLTGCVHILVKPDIYSVKKLMILSVYMNSGSALIS